VRLLWFNKNHKFENNAAHTACYISSTTATFFAKPTSLTNQILPSNDEQRNPVQRSVHRMSFASLKIIFLLLNQNTFLLPQLSFFYSHPPRGLWKSRDISNIIIILYCFFNHATLDISALFIVYTHILSSLLFFLITQPRGSQSWVIFQRESRI
jgi:hypothetical protein